MLLACPHCGEPFAAPPEQAGQVVTCHCGGQFAVPIPQGRPIDRHKRQAERGTGARAAGLVMSLAGGLGLWVGIGVGSSRELTPEQSMPWQSLAMVSAITCVLGMLSYAYGRILRSFR